MLKLTQELSSYMVQTELYEARTCTYMLEVAKQQVCMSVSCMLHTFLKYNTSNILVAAPMQPATMKLSNAVMKQRMMYMCSVCSV